MLRRPPDILITTPESLFLVLTSRARAFLESVDTVIVDEIHALVGTKRGAHLALTLERLEEVARRPLQRIGLSATQRPARGGRALPRRRRGPAGVEAAAGDDRRRRGEEGLRPPGRGAGRGHGPARGGPGAVGGRRSPRSRPASCRRRSIWPAIHPRLLELVRAHRSTILFVNSRRLAERLAAALNELAGEEIARAHHGSIAREQRLLIEDALKAGRLPALVATSSLELGIDMGAVDLVVQIETPTSVASGMQRIGRASHQVEAVSRGIIFPKYRGDLLASAAITKAMKEGAVEETRVPRNPLDVLAQQLVAMVALGERKVDELYALVRRAAPYSALGRAQFEGVLDMLSGRYPSDEFAELRPRVVWDRLRGRRASPARARSGSSSRTPAPSPTGASTASSSPTARAGASASASSTRRWSSRAARARSSSSAPRAGGSPRSRATACSSCPPPASPGRCRSGRPTAAGGRSRWAARSAASPASSSPTTRDEATERLQRDHDLDPLAAQNLLAYLEEQREATGVLPDDRTIVLERTRDEMGDWRLCLLSPWGGRVHAPWAIALEARLRQAGEAEVESIWSDDGIVLRLPERERPPEAADLLPEPEEIEDLVVRELGGTSLFAARFREAAARALLLPRRRPGQRTPLWMQRKRAHDLLQVAARYPSFPIVLEAYRECLRDVFDLPGLVELARRVRRREIRLVTVDTQAPSPFSASLLFGYVANYLYDGDAPARRAARAGPGRGPGAAARAPRRGGAARAPRPPRPRRAGAGAAVPRRGPPGHEPRAAPRPAAAPRRPLDGRGGGARAAAARRRRRRPPRTAWLGALERERRAIRVRVAGEERWAAAEDAGRLRDALGVAPPPGLPGAFLERQPHALREVVSRYARTHGPFTLDRSRPSLRDGRGVRPRRPRRAREGRPRPRGRVPARGPRARVVRGGRARDAAPPLARRAAQAGRAGRADGPRAAPRGLAGRRPRARHRAAAPTRSSTSSSSSRARLFPPRSSSATCCPRASPATGPRTSTRCARRARWSGSASARSATATVASPSSWPTTCRSSCRRVPRRRRATSTTGSASTSPRTGRPSSASPRRGRGRAGAAGRGRAVGPRLGGRGHERHAGGAARLPGGARGRGRSGATAWRASARVGRSRPRPSAAGACCPSAATGPERHREDEGPRRAAAEAPRRPHPRRGGVRGGAGRLLGRLPGAEGPRGGGPHPPRLLRGRPRRPAVRRPGRPRPAARAAGARPRRAAGRRPRRGRPREPLRRRARLAEERGRSPRAGGGPARRPRGRGGGGGREPRRAAGDGPPAGRGARPVAHGGPPRGPCATGARRRSRPALGWAVGEGEPLAESPLAPFLAEAGFVRSGPGFRTPRDSSGANPEGLLPREP